MSRFAELTLLALFLGLVVTACEDDPILAPTEEESSGGGSYGRIQQLPPPAADSFQVEVDSTAVPRPDRSSNPKRF